MGLEPKFLRVSSEEFLVSPALPATPWSLGLLEVEPVWAPDWRSGEGDWRPWLGADIFGCCLLVFCGFGWEVWGLRGEGVRLLVFGGMWLEVGRVRVVRLGALKGGEGVKLSGCD